MCSSLGHFLLKLLSKTQLHPQQNSHLNLLNLSRKIRTVTVKGIFFFIFYVAEQSNMACKAFNRTIIGCQRYISLSRSNNLLQKCNVTQPKFNILTFSFPNIILPRVYSEDVPTKNIKKRRRIISSSEEDSPKNELM